MVKNDSFSFGERLQCAGLAGKNAESGRLALLSTQPNAFSERDIEFVKQVTPLNNRRQQTDREHRVVQLVRDFRRGRTRDLCKHHR